MESKSKTVVVQDGNPRGDKITLDEVKQTITDIESWLQKNVSSVSEALKKVKPATQDEINRLETVLKNKIPESLQALFLKFNGNFPLKDNYRSMSIKEIEESIEVNQVNGYWNKSYIPFAANDDNEFLCLQADKGEEKKVVAWSTDEGVIEEIADNLGLLLEKMRNGILKKKVQYIEGAGFIEESDAS